MVTRRLALSCKFALAATFIFNVNICISQEPSMGSGRVPSVLALSVAALDYAKRCAESFMLHTLRRCHVANTKWRAHLTQFFALIEVRQAPPTSRPRNLPEQY